MKKIHDKNVPLCDTLHADVKMLVAYNREPTISIMIHKAVEEYIKQHHAEFLKHARLVGTSYKEM